MMRLTSGATHACVFLAFSLFSWPCFLLFFCFFFQTKGVCVFCFCLDSMLSFVCLFFLSSKTVLKLLVSLEEKNEKRLENLSQNQNRFWNEKMQKKTNENTHIKSKTILELKKTKRKKHFFARWASPTLGPQAELKKSERNLEGKHPKCWGQVRSSALCHTVMHTQFGSYSSFRCFSFPNTELCAWHSKACESKAAAQVLSILSVVQRRSNLYKMY